MLESNNNISEIGLKSIIKYIGIVISGVLVATLLLTLIYAIPVENMRNHVKDSLWIQHRENDYMTLMESGNSRLDGFTDAIMLKNAIYNGKENALVKAMRVPSNLFKLKTNSPTAALIADAENMQPKRSGGYERYWHGYLLFLKPLLLVLDYGQIRLVNMFCQILLTCLVLAYMLKRKLTRYIPALILSLCFLTPIVLPLSLQFSSVFYVMLLTMLALLKYDLKIENPKLMYLFLFSGMATSFLDFLTYPLVVA